MKSQVTSQGEKSEAGAEVNICQASNLILQEESIGKLAERIVQENIGEKEVEAIRRALVETATDTVAGSSRISRLRRELRELNAPEKIITAVLDRETTCASNKIQKERRKLRKDEGIHFPDEFSFESVKERLDDYDVSRKPDELALADVMIMLCIRPAELRTLRIANGKVTGYVKNRGQENIPRVFRSMGKDEEQARQLLTWIQNSIASEQLKDPSKPRAKWFNRFLKKYDVLLLPRYLRKLGAVFAVVSHEAKNLSNAMDIASEALRHSPDNHASPGENYTIVNLRKRGERYDQARAFMIFDEN